MILTIPENTTFELSPVKYSLNALTTGVNNNLSNNGFTGDTTFILESKFPIPRITFPAVSTVDVTITLTGEMSVESFDGLIGKVMHIPTGTNKGVYVIIDIDKTNGAWMRLSPTFEPSDYVVEASTDSFIGYWTAYSDSSLIRASVPTNSIARKSFVGKDMWSLVDEAKSYLSKNMGARYNNWVESDLGVMLIELLAYMSESSSWFIDFIANEQSLQNSNIQNNVKNHSRFLNYKPKASVGSSTSVTLTLLDEYGLGSVVVPSGTQAKTANGIVFETINDATFQPASKNATVKVNVVEGETETDVFIGSGGVNQIFVFADLPKNKMTLKGVKVSVNGTVWTEVDTLEFGKSEQFEIDYVGTPNRIIFGNGLTGAIPAKSSIIAVKRRLGYGRMGNVASGTITEMVSIVTLQDDTVVNISINNSNPAVGGSDSESIESIKTNAPKFALTSDRAVTQNDWDFLASNFTGDFGSIAIAKAQILRGLDQNSTLKVLFDSFESSVSYLGNQISVSASELGSTKFVTDVESMVQQLESLRLVLEEMAYENRAIQTLGDSLLGISSNEL